MITLTYGQKVPEQGDRGAPLFQALEDNITRADGHNHDGVNSPLLTPIANVGVPETILAAGWVTYGGPTGFYRQLVTMASGFNYDTCQISFRTVAGAVIYPSTERVSSTTYYVYTIDNTIDFIALYGG